MTDQNHHRDLAEVPVDKIIERYAERLKTEERSRIIAESSVERLMTLAMESREEAAQLRQQLIERDTADAERQQVIEGEKVTD